MSSFTPKEIRDLYEAYSSVYVDETESILNELLDEVTNNINELVNEGWDFSEYSWDELYESFLDNVLEPELEKVESFIETLNESAETLSEEQIESLLQEWGWFSALSKIGQAKKAAQAVTSATGPVSRPSILQAPLVRGPKPAPSTSPLQAPVRPVQPKKPLPSGLSVTGAPEKGGVVTQLTNWARNLGKKPPATPPPTPPKPPAAKPPTGQPRQPFQMPDLRPASQRMSQGYQSATRRLGDVANLAKNVVKRTPEFVKKVAIPAAKIAIRGSLVGAGGMELANQGMSIAQNKGFAPSPAVAGAASAFRLSSRAASALADRSNPSYAAGFRSSAQSASNIAKELDAYNIRQEKQAAAKDKKSGTPSPSPSKPKKLFPEGLSLENIISEGPDWKSAPKPKGIAALTLGKETKVYIPGLGWQFPKTARNWARSQGYTDWNKIPNPSQPAKPTKQPSAAQQPARQPAAQQPARQPAPQASPVAPKPAPVPFGKTMPAPASAALDKYKINKDWAAANPRLAQAQVKRAEQRASGKSAFDPEFRKSTINPILYKPGALKAEETMTKDAYDLVLEYLLSEGHADTIEEAHYVMLQMDAEHIQNIVESPGEWFRGIFNPNNSVAFKAQNTSPFNRPVTPLPKL
jgi:hypothetical protein